MLYIWLYHSIFSLYLLRTSAAKEPAVKMKPNLVRLVDYLMDGYNKGVRPVQNWRQATTVYIDINIYAILGVNEKNQVLTTYIWYNQSWVDEFLTWDPSEFDNVTLITIPTRCVWVPDIVVIEFVDFGKTPDIGYIYINNKGRIFNNKPIQIISSCSFDMYYFPFDRQNCTITFTSWTHTIQDINISFWRNVNETNNFQTLFKNEGEWELVNVIPSYSVFNDDQNNYGELKFFTVFKNDGELELVNVIPSYKVFSNDDHSFGELKFFIIFERQPLFYIVTLLIPSMFLMAMDLVGFYLPAESGERVSFKITLLLEYSIGLIVVTNHSPPTGTPLISLYFILCLILLVINLMESILIVHIVHQKNHHEEVPQWLKTLVLKKMATWFCMKKRVQFGKSFNNVSENMETCSTAMSYSNEHGKDYNSQLIVKKDSEVLFCILKEIGSIRECLMENDEHRITKEWLQVGYIVDNCLFRAYLVVLSVYALAITIAWFQLSQD